VLFIFKCIHFNSYVTNRVDPIEVFKLVCTGRVISSRRSMVYMSKMDADIQQQIRHEVVNAVAQSPEHTVNTYIFPLLLPNRGKIHLYLHNN
jgi:hypothetical protein